MLPNKRSWLIENDCRTADLNQKFRTHIQRKNFLSLYLTFFNQLLQDSKSNILRIFQLHTRNCQNSLLFIALFLKLYWIFKKEGEFPLDYPLNFNGLTKALGIEGPYEGFIFLFFISPKQLCIYLLQTTYQRYNVQIKKENDVLCYEDFLDFFHPRNLKRVQINLQN